MNLAQHLDLDRCPHCRIDHPNLTRQLFYNIDAQRPEYRLLTDEHLQQHERAWSVYVCSRCGGVVLAAAISYGNNEVDEVSEIYPAPIQVDEALPPTAKEYLIQAINSLHAPAGAVMLCASAVDAMLKTKKYTTGSLYTRINKAADDNLITEGMKEWAHEVRLDANDQRPR